MKFLDITNDQKDKYVLKENEQGVFFLRNRSGKITFDLQKSGAAAHIFAFFSASDDEAFNLEIVQWHQAPHTTSALVVKSALGGQATLEHTGLIRIEKGADKTSATQECRSLLLSENAAASAIPSLEILANDVVCHHAATVSPLNPEALFFAESRGLSEDQARTLLVQGFFHEAVERMEKLGVPNEAVIRT